MSIYKNRGWFKQPVRHAKARKYGKAGGNYKRVYVRVKKIKPYTYMMIGRRPRDLYVVANNKKSALKHVKKKYDDKFVYEEYQKKYSKIVLPKGQKTFKFYEKIDG